MFKSKNLEEVKVEEPDFPSVMVLTPIPNTSYGFSKYKSGIIRQQQNRLRFNFPDHKN